MLTDEEIQEYAASMPYNSTKVLLDLNNEAYLGIIFKNELETINSVLHSKVILNSKYVLGTNELLIKILPVSASSEGIVLPIPLGEKQLEKVLVNLGNNLGSIHIYYASNDLNTMCDSEILKNFDARLLLKRQLQIAGLVDSL